MRRDFAICAGLVVLTLAAYWPLGAFDFVNYDDPLYVYENPHVCQALSWANVGWAFTSVTSSNWHPLTMLSHMLDVQLFGLKSGCHHAVNLVFHAANTLLLFLVLRRMTAAVWKSAMVAALFALHPLHVESVAWIAERKDVLSTFLGLLTLAAYVRYARKPGYGRYALVFLLFALGLMAKPMLVTLPFVFLLLDYWPLGRLMTPTKIQKANEEQPSDTAQKSRKPRHKHAPTVGESPLFWQTAGWLVLEKLPLLILVILSSIVTWIAQQQVMFSFEHVPFGPRIWNALLAYIRYLGKMLWPIDLSLPYPIDISPNAGRVLLAVAILVVISTAAVWAARSKRPYVAVGWFWYLGTLVPVIGIVQVGIQGMADRYTYIPSIGIFIVAVWGLAELTTPWDQRHFVTAALAIVVLAACFLRTRDQLQYWRNTEKLFLHSMDVIPGNLTMRINLVAWYGDHKRPAEAAAQAEALLKVDPRNVEAHTYLAHALIDQQRWDEAAAHLKIAIESDPSSAAAHNHYGAVLFAKGNVEEAIQQFREAVQLEPETARLRQNLAWICFKTDRYEEAAQELLEVLRLDPHSVEAADLLASVLQKQGKSSEAVDLHRRLLQSDPKNVNARNNLALALLAAGKSKEALAQWREILRLQPDDVVALNAIAWIQATSSDSTLRDGKQAVQLAEKAVQLTNEKSPEMLDTLAAAYAEAGRFSDALATASKAVERAALSGRPDLAAKIRARRELYKNQKPYREMPER